MPKKPEYRLVEITWEDHASDDSWLDKDDIAKTRELVVVKSVGWLIDDSAKSYVLAGTISEDGDFSCAQTIGKGLVVQIKDVGRVRRNRKARDSSGSSDPRP